MSNRKPPSNSITKRRAKAVATNPKINEADGASKKEQVLALLQSATGTTITALMQTTGWQQHSVRGFLAAVVRKKLKLKLESKKVDGGRIYRIDGSASKTKRRAA